MNNGRVYLWGGPLDGETVHVGRLGMSPKLVLAVPTDPPRSVWAGPPMDPEMRIRYVVYRWVRFAPRITMIDFQLDHPGAIGCDMVFEYDDVEERAAALNELVGAIMRDEWEMDS